MRGQPVMRPVRGPGLGVPSSGFVCWGWSGRMRGSYRRFPRTCRLDAVTASRTLPWNSGVAEGHVNRIKLLKHRMFGRAGFQLLRQTALLA